MRYQLTPIFCRPWLLNGLSQRLIESHYENNYGGALRRLNAITEKLESLVFAATPGYALNSLKRGSDRSHHRGGHRPGRAIHRRRNYRADGAAHHRIDLESEEVARTCSGRRGGDHRALGLSGRALMTKILLSIGYSILHRT